MKQKLVTETTNQISLHDMADALRHADSEGVEQCVGHLNEGRAYCAIGVILNYFGYDLKYGKMIELLIPFGIDYEDIYEKNDEGKTFVQIADWLDSLE